MTPRNVFVGKHREVNWQPMGEEAIATFNTDTTTRGFTGHEQIDTVGLIHMNGRVYDAELGRFLSADPHIQALDNLQNFNRYSYVLNNPLSYTDPTGFFFSKLFKAIGKAFGKIFKAIGRAFKKLLRSPIFRAIIQIVACSNPATCVIASGAITAAMGGSIGDVFKAMAMSFVQMAAFHVVGRSIIDPFVAGLKQAGTFATAAGRATLAGFKGLVHGVVGGALSVAQGGNFIQGFASSALGAAAGVITHGADIAAGTAIAAAAGCAGAVLSGGKCANGAVTSAIAYLYNTAAKLRRQSRWVKQQISMRKKVDGDWHLFEITGLICRTVTSGCNTALADQVFDYINRHDVPFSDKDLGSGHKMLADGWLWPLRNQPIEHIEYPDIRTTINQTKQGHNFHPGTVRLKVYFQGSSLLYTVRGQGTGNYPMFNNIMGPILFRPGVENAVSKFGR